MRSMHTRSAGQPRPEVRDAECDGTGPRRADQPRLRDILLVQLCAHLDDAQHIDICGEIQPYMSGRSWSDAQEQMEAAAAVTCCSISGDKPPQSAGGWSDGASSSLSAGSGTDIAARGVSLAAGNAALKSAWTCEAGMSAGV